MASSASRRRRLDRPPPRPLKGFVAALQAVRDLSRVPRIHSISIRLDQPYDRQYRRVPADIVADQRGSRCRLSVICLTHSN